MLKSVNSRNALKRSARRILLAAGLLSAMAMAGTPTQDPTGVTILDAAVDASISTGSKTYAPPRKSNEGKLPVAVKSIANRFPDWTPSQDSTPSLDCSSESPNDGANSTGSAASLRLVAAKKAAQQLPSIQTIVPESSVLRESTLDEPNNDFQFLQGVWYNSSGFTLEVSCKRRKVYFVKTKNTYELDINDSTGDISFDRKGGERWTIIQENSDLKNGVVCWTNGRRATGTTCKYRVNDVVQILSETQRWLDVKILEVNDSYTNIGYMIKVKPLDNTKSCRWVWNKDNEIRFREVHWKRTA